MYRIVVASDSFKGSLTSEEVAQNVEAGICHVCPSCKVDTVCVADGGEGTTEALCRTLGGELVQVTVSDPLGRPVRASYAVLADGRTAVMEMSEASGLPLLKECERNPLKTSTYGTGELIADALKRGCRRFLIGIGGSATNDAGMGMLTALGFRFLDADGNVLPGIGESLNYVADIDDSEVLPAVSEAGFTVACDVDAPLYGPRGAACVFAPQKGADPDTVKVLDEGLRHFSDVMIRCMGKDVGELPGAGAAGGLGGGFVAFLNATLTPGIEMVLDAIDFDAVISGADLVITGEGRIDSQTLGGKTPYGIMLRAKKQGIKVAAIGGSVGLDDASARAAGFDFICQATPDDMPLETAMLKDIASANVRNAAEKIMNLYIETIR